MKNYFSHDYNSRNDPKLIKVMMKHGIAGIGAYWCLIELCYEEGGKLLLSECDSYAFAFRTEYDMIISLVNDFGLFEKDDSFFWSGSCLSRIDKMNEKSRKAAESAEKRWNNANAMQTHSDSNAIKRKESKRKESKVNKSNINTKSVSVADAPTSLENLESDEKDLEDNAKKGKEKSSAKKESPGLTRAKTSYSDLNCQFGSSFKNVWLKLCEAPKWKTKPQSAINYNLSKLMEYEEAFAISLCEHSIRGNYQGVVFDNTDEKYQKYLMSKNGNPTNTKFKSPAERKQSRDNLGAIADAILRGVASN